MGRRGKAKLRLGDIDPFGIVEAAYRDGATDEAWLGELARRLAPGIEDEQGYAAWLYALPQAADPKIHLWGFVGTAPDGWIDAAKGAATRGDPSVMTTYRRMGAFSIVGDDPSFAQSELYREVLRPTGLVDQVVLGGSDLEGHGICVCASHGAILALDDEERRLLTRLTSHMLAGFRLRRRLHDGDVATEAVYELSGNLVHAEGPARTREARAALRAAVTTIDAVRRKQRKSDPADALGRWKALVGGRWSLVDQFERSGRHFLVAKPNEARHVKPARLARREAQVVAHAALGHPNKVIAYELGLTESAVAAYLTRAKTKLGARSRIELIAAVAAAVSPGAKRSTDRANQIEVMLGGDRFTVLAGEQLPMFAPLTTSERDVVWAALAGDSNEGIARARGCSARTVANQLASAYKKLDVASRSELACRLRALE